MNVKTRMYAGIISLTRVEELMIANRKVSFGVFGYTMNILNKNHYNFEINNNLNSEMAYELYLAVEPHVKYELIISLLESPNVKVSLKTTMHNNIKRELNVTN